MRISKLLSTDKFFLSLLLLLSLIFFYPFLLKGLLPIPADTIVGMYHPYLDLSWGGFANGVPYKNFLITDPVRQQFVWRYLAVDAIKKGSLPIWNPYSFSGTPLLANFQSAVFYPLNFIFFILPFNLAWGILVMLQPILGGIFMYLYLKSLNLGKLSSFLGAFVFSYSGFFIVWLEWNTIGHVIIWLPLSLLSIEKIFQNIALWHPPRRSSLQDKPFGHLPGVAKRLLEGVFRNKQVISWSIIYIFSLASSFFAGHIQIFFYSFLVIIGYTIIRVLSLQKNKLKVYLLFVTCYLLFALITSVQWVPTLKFILQSSREFDQGTWLKEGWFIPFAHLIQFIVPDFFGHPATLNYWGVWNYGEFVGYIGIIPLIFALYAIFYRRDKKALFFGALVFLGLVFSLPTPLARLPFELNLPLISSSQPTRLIFVIDFALSILTALGFDRLLKDKSLKRNLYILLPVGIILYIIWMVALFPQIFGLLDLKENLKIGTRNLILPTLIFTVSAILMIIDSIKIKFNLSMLFVICYLLIVVFDLYRFGWKFTPFNRSEWIFPKTQILSYLQNNNLQGRIMSLDRGILPPNFSGFYKLQDVAGYDPLYFDVYNKLVSSWNAGKPVLKSSAFNRIVTPENPDSVIADLLSVRYILSLSPLIGSNYKLILKEGKTNLYENVKALPRIYFVNKVIKVENQIDELSKIFEIKNDLRSTAVSSSQIQVSDLSLTANDSISILDYEDNYVKINLHANATRLLVFTDIFSNIWRAYLDKQETRIYRVNYALRGVIIPEGDHIIEFKTNII